MNTSALKRGIAPPFASSADAAVKVGVNNPAVNGRVAAPFAFFTDAAREQCGALQRP